MKAAATIILIAGTLARCCAATENAAPAPEEMVTVPRSAIGMLPPAKDEQRYTAGNGSQDVLAQIHGLQAEIALDNDALVKFAATMETQCPLPQEGTTEVKYFNGVSHEQHGLMPVGSIRYGVDPRIPPAANESADEFHYKDGKLDCVVHREKNGERKVSWKALYDGDKVIALLCYSKDGLSSGEYAKYKNGKLVLKCRIFHGHDHPISQEVFFWNGDVEEYTVNYVCRLKGPSPGMVLESIQLPNGLMSFDAYGRLKNFSVFAPAKK